MADGRGGKREGAGRPRRAEKFERPIATAEKRIADRLPEIVENLHRLANGGYERVEERWEPAGLVFKESYLRRDDGELQLDMHFKPIKMMVPAFPELPPEQLVLVGRTRSVADRDRAANIYLADRILGKPTERKEISTPDGGAVVVRHEFEKLRKLPAEELVSLFRDAIGE